MPQRGRWMGNRGGCLHDDAGRLGTARWRTRAWLICRLEFKGWYRKVMQPGLYTELFFFDEATALAAGRPRAIRHGNHAAAGARHPRGGVRAAGRPVSRTRSVRIH